MNLFGTDGIRGRITSSPDSDAAALVDLLENRCISKRLFRLVGEALAATLESKSKVMIGWDDRAGNEKLCRGLVQGLHLRGMTVHLSNEVATPALQASMLQYNAAMGLMITASHNPVSDSGIKVFDMNGYKSTPEYEEGVSSIAEQLAAEEREVDTPELMELALADGEVDGLAIHLALLEKRVPHFRKVFGGGELSAIIPYSGLLLDTSGGSAREWAENWLKRVGLPCEMVKIAGPMNESCGAGEMSPTRTWLWQDFLANPHEHALLDHLAERCSEGPPPDWRPGTVVGAALDGDGDRCLCIEVSPEGTGLRVVNGDMMVDEMLSAARLNSKRAWRFAASVEADLGLLQAHAESGDETEIMVTAVGDRWLSRALAPPERDKGSLLYGLKMPAVIGSEDSGHIVMAAPHPSKEKHWSLVGDGVATLLAFLHSRARLAGEDNTGFAAGWKKRYSVKGTDRSLWTGDNSLADDIEQIAKRSMTKWSHLRDWSRDEIDGEPNLMMLSARFDDGLASLAIRNSGTEAKTNASLRMSPSMVESIDSAEELLNEVVAILERALVT